MRHVHKQISLRFQFSGIGAIERKQTLYTDDLASSCHLCLCQSTLPKYLQVHYYNTIKSPKHSSLHLYSSCKLILKLLIFGESTVCDTHNSQLPVKNGKHWDSIFVTWLFVNTCTCTVHVPIEILITCRPLSQKLALVTTTHNAPAQNPVLSAGCFI